MTYPVPNEPVKEIIDDFSKTEEYSLIIQARLEGSQACSNGMGSSNNPYHVCSLEGSNWLDGWLKEFNSQTVQASV